MEGRLTDAAQIRKHEVYDRNEKSRDVSSSFWETTRHRENEEITSRMNLFAMLTGRYINLHQTPRCNDSRLTPSLLADDYTLLLHDHFRLYLERNSLHAMFRSSIFDPKWKLRGHIIVFLLAILVIILTGVYINLAAFITRAEIMAIPFVSTATGTHPHTAERDKNCSVCSVCSICAAWNWLYLTLSTPPPSAGRQVYHCCLLSASHRTYLSIQKWKSLKANFILNCIEPVFWLTLIILKVMGISRSCSGPSCAVTWVIMVIAVAIL